MVDSDNDFHMLIPIIMGIMSGAIIALFVLVESTNNAIEQQMKVNPSQNYKSECRK